MVRLARFESLVARLGDRERIFLRIHLGRVGLKRNLEGSRLAPALRASHRRSLCRCDALSAVVIPSGHAEHAGSPSRSAKNPSSHDSHEMVRAKSLENKPTGHALQPKPNSRSWSSEVSSGRNVPGAQTSHSEDSPSSATKPGWQGDVTVKFASAPGVLALLLNARQLKPSSPCAPCTMRAPGRGWYATAKRAAASLNSNPTV